jgi:hypothetical protein
LGQRQYYNMRRWRFWLGTETLEVLAWDRDVGGSGLGQRRWRFWHGSETLEVLAWDRDIGGSGLGQRQTKL